MPTPHQDRSWMFFIPMFCIIVWIWVLNGCATIPTAGPSVAEVVEFRIPEPPDVFKNGMIPFGTEAKCPSGKPDILIGRPEQFTVVYAYEKGDGKLVVFMITLLQAPGGGYITNAWVDADGDGTYDLYFDNEGDLIEAYDKPCDAIGIPA